MADAVRLFGEKMKLSCIAALPQAHRSPRLILNLSEITDKGTPGVNKTTNRGAALDSLQFGRTFPCILQVVWEA